MSWFVFIFADGNKLTLQWLSFQQENERWFEAGIQWRRHSVYPYPTDFIYIFKGVNFKLFSHSRGGLAYLDNSLAKVPGEQLISDMEAATG